MGSGRKAPKLRIWFWTAQEDHQSMAKDDPANRETSNQAYAVGSGTVRALAELVQRVQESLSDEWTLDRMASVLGYAPHHLAHAFRATFGTTPVQYVRTLRLERAAHELVTSEKTLEDVAKQAGYDSITTFRRAFGRVFGSPPLAVRCAGRIERWPHRGAIERHRDIELPQGLSGPTIAPFGPFFAESLRVTGTEAKDLLAGLMRFMAIKGPPTEAWRWGVASPPHGWATFSTMREFRWICIADTAHAVVPPLEVWRMPNVPICARFDFEGSGKQLYGVFGWIFRTWLPNTPFRYRYAPTLTLYDPSTWTPSGFSQWRARIFIPIECR
jgi:AraC-like DNA-binding protein